MCCLSCKVRKDNFYNFSGISLLGWPFPMRTHGDFIAEVERQVIPVVVPDDTARDALVNALDFKHTYPWGRCVATPIFGLRRGDRLVISDKMRDICMLEELPTPAIVSFFRSQKDTGIAGVSILFSIPGLHQFGIDHLTMDMICHDVLHCGDLGIAQKFTALGLWRLVGNNAYNLPYALKDAEPSEVVNPAETSPAEDCEHCSHDDGVDTVVQDTLAPDQATEEHDTNWARSWSWESWSWHCRWQQSDTETDTTRPPTRGTAGDPLPTTPKPTRKRSPFALVRDYVL